jgi:hypothetical protein
MQHFTIRSRKSEFHDLYVSEDDVLIFSILANDNTFSFSMMSSNFQGLRNSLKNARLVKALIEFCTRLPAMCSRKPKSPLAVEKNDSSFERGL